MPGTGLAHGMPQPWRIWAAKHVSPGAGGGEQLGGEEGSSQSQVPKEPIWHLLRGCLLEAKREKRRLQDRCGNRVIPAGPFYFLFIILMIFKIPEMHSCPCMAWKCFSLPETMGENRPEQQWGRGLLSEG